MICSGFFEELFKTNDMSAALDKYLPSMKLYHCERLLARALTNYYRKACIGKGKRSRLENLLTEYRNQHGIADDQSVSDIRSSLKDMLKNKTNQSLFDRYSRAFLMGRPFSYSFEDMIVLLREEGLIV